MENEREKRKREVETIVYDRMGKEKGEEFLKLIKEKGK